MNQASSLLSRSSVVVSVGNKPKAERSVFRFAVAALAIGVATFGSPAMAGDLNGSNIAPASQQQVQMDRVPATVVRVRQAAPTATERQEQSIKHRGSSFLQSAAGTALGGFLGSKIGGKKHRYLGATLGSIGGALAMTEIKKWREDRHHDSNIVERGASSQPQVVTVRVNLGSVSNNNTLVNGQVADYDVTVPAGVAFVPGQAVYLVPNSDGRNVDLVPATPANTYRPR